VIVQKVTKTIDIKKVSSPTVAMSAAEIDLYVTDPSSSTNLAGQMVYWELWRVGPRGGITPTNEDCFGLCAIIPRAGGTQDTTLGTFTMKGEAAFYATTATDATLGFTANGVAAAGGLASTTADPTRNLPAPTSNVVTRTVAVTWDSSVAPTSRNGSYGDSTVTQTIV